MYINHFLSNSTLFFFVLSFFVLNEMTDIYKDNQNNQTIPDQMIKSENKMYTLPCGHQDHINNYNKQFLYREFIICPECNQSVQTSVLIPLRSRIKNLDIDLDLFSLDMDENEKVDELSKLLDTIDYDLKNLDRNDIIKWFPGCDSINDSMNIYSSPAAIYLNYFLEYVSSQLPIEIRLLNIKLNKLKKLKNIPRTVVLSNQKLNNL